MEYKNCEQCKKEFDVFQNSNNKEIILEKGDWYWIPNCTTTIINK